MSLVGMSASMPAQYSARTRLSGKSAEGSRGSRRKAPGDSAVAGTLPVAACQVYVILG